MLVRSRSCRPALRCSTATFWAFAALLGLQAQMLPAADGLDDVGDGVLREHHAAERTLLREQVVRGSALTPAGLAVVDRPGDPDVRDRQLHDLRYGSAG